MTSQHRPSTPPSTNGATDSPGTEAADAAVAACKAAISTAWGLYERGQYVDALADIDKLVKRDMPPEHRQELFALKAWCHYRRNEWVQSLQSCDLADNHQRALECELYIRSYVADYGDEARISSLQNAIGATINTANAFLIRARSTDPVPYEQVEAILSRFANAPANTPTVHYANLLHNAGRVFLDKSRSNADFDQAESLIRTAIANYGEGPENLHHKGAAYFWLSMTYEKRNDFAGAFAEAVNSENCWRLQVEGNAQSDAHRTKYENAQKRTIEMAKRAGIPIEQ